LSERLGAWNFWLYLLGANLTFAPMLVLGLRGMTRRIFTYPADFAWADLNLISTIGSLVLGLSFLIFIINVARALTRPPVGAANPWDAPTLEWATASPPPPYNFAFTPVAESRWPLWKDRSGDLPYATGLRTDRKEIIVTTAVEAQAVLRDIAPSPTIWPLLAAIVTTGMLVGSIYTPSALVYGAIPVGLALVGWLYPRKAETVLPNQEEMSA
jgi:cytochrome c oxidase subunit I+III